MIRARTLSFSVLALSLWTVSAPGGVLEKVYTFPEPAARPVAIQVHEGAAPEWFQGIFLEGCPSAAVPGAPVIPHFPVRLLLPQGTSIDRIEVVTSIPERLVGAFLLPPSQRSFPLSAAAERKPTPPDPVVYASAGIYPSRLHSEHKILWCRGYQMLSLNLFPIRYEPKQRAVHFTRRMTLKIHTRPEAAPLDVVRCRGRLADRLWIEGMVQNPGQAAQYKAAQAPAGPGGRGGKMRKGKGSPGADPFIGSHHPYVVITNEALASDPGPFNFQELIAHRAARGLPGLLVTVESIYADYPGQDDQEKIRNFCRFAYENWNTEYILLGGDGNDSGPGRIVPARGMWATGEGYVENNLKADLYYGNLDGSFNANGNSKWGEREDGPDGGEVDLLAELFVGRASVETPEELHRFVQKTIAHETGDFTEPWYTGGLFVGEFLWSNPDTWGGTYMDEIKDGSNLYGYTSAGFPSSWFKSTLYEKDGNWWPSKLINELNADKFHLVNHLGHANSAMVMKLSPSDVKGLKNARYFFAYSQGCMAGEFAMGDCMAEHFTLSERGAFGAVMNDKYGWGELGCTDGSSQYFHRQFIDALFGEGMVEAGRVNADSKEDNIWCIDYKSNRWCAYETNLFGDPAAPLAGPLLTSKGLLGLDRSAYKDGGLVEITLKDLDLNQVPSAREEVSLPVTSAGNDQEDAVLRETGFNTGIFIGHLAVDAGSAVPGSGALELSHGESFTVTYVDADNGFGGTNIQVLAKAEADFIPPVISNVHLAFAGDTRAEVAWQTNEPCTGMLVYGMETPPDQTACNDQLLTNGFVQAENLLQCSHYFYYAIASDAAGNESVEDNGGSYYLFSTLQRFYPMREEMNEDPVWTLSPGGRWEWGIPAGLSGDPSAGHTGPWVYGYELNGPYGNGMPPKHLTTPALDCTGLSQVTLDFWRQLPIWGSPGDNASLSVSADGINWKEIYHNPISPYIEPCWIHWTYDISSVADGQPTVYIRWTMGPTDSGGTHGGWNIDDVTVSGVAAPATAWLEYHGHAIDDSVNGNGNGLIEPCETLVMPLTLHNTGLDASSVQAVLKAYTPNIVLHGNQAAFPDLLHNELGTSTAPHFSFSVKDGVVDGEELILGVDWIAGPDAGSFTIIEHVECPRLVFAGSEIQEAAGDGDGLLDPGETATLVVEVENPGSVAAGNVSAQITCSHPQYITIHQDLAGFGDIPKGGKASSQAPHFSVTADPSTPNYTLVEFTLHFTGQNYVGEDHFFIEVTDCNLQYFFPLDSDPGWTGTGLWEFGVPLGKLPPGTGAGCPDPTSGYTGANVLGYNLLGSYYLFMKPETLTSGPFDCSNLESVKVRFKRWLGVASAQYDHAAFQASKDGVNFITVWEHTEPVPISDGQWVHVEYDISSLADHESTVYLRWIMGPTSYILVYCGWNIDDIEVWGR